MNAKELVLNIHKTPYKATLAITGGGAEAIGELLRYGSGSNTLIEAVVPYDQKAFDSYVKGTPDKYCSGSAARDLAMAAFQRAVKFTGDEGVIGIGVTCSLAKDGERAGREHHAYIAAQTRDTTTTYHLDVSAKWPGLGREEEEAIVSNAIIDILADACGLEVPNFNIESTLDSSTDALGLVTGKTPFQVYKPASRYAPVENRIIFPGSFNPLHEQHKKIAETVFKNTGRPVDLEICVHNVDKPTMNYTTLAKRKDGLTPYLNEPWLGNIYFTSLPTFLDKARHFPNATFLVGWDTFKRIGDPKYADLSLVMKGFKECGTKFLVAHRIMNGKSSVDDGIDGIYPPLLEMATIIPPDEFPLSECSSREIRKKENHE